VRTSNPTYIRGSFIIFTVHQIIFNREAKSRRMRETGHVARLGQIREANETSFEEPSGKRLLETTIRRLEYNIKTNLKEEGLGVEWN
jgi:hypothetical protein